MGDPLYAVRNETLAGVEADRLLPDFFNNRFVVHAVSNKKSSSDSR